MTSRQTRTTVRRKPSANTTRKGRASRYTAAPISVASGGWPATPPGRAARPGRGRRWRGGTGPSAAPRADGAQPAAAEPGAADRDPAAAALDHPPRRDDHRHVPAARPLAGVDHEVAGTQPAADLGEAGELPGRGPRDGDAGVPPGRPGQARAVVGVRALRAPAVGLAKLAAGERDGGAGPR